MSFQPKSPSSSPPHSPATDPPRVKLRVIESDDHHALTRGECMKELRPCQRVKCRFHMGKQHLEAAREPDGEYVPTCALDIADQGPHTLEEIAEAMGITRERVRQLEAMALDKLRRRYANDPEVLELLTEYLESVTYDFGQGTHGLGAVDCTPMVGTASGAVHYTVGRSKVHPTRA